jgi:fibronectin type 3 domain-containing protein
MRKMKHLYAAILFLLCAVQFKALYGQSNSAIYARSFHAGDSVMLRWIPSNYQNWQYGNSVGYKITRFNLDDYFEMSDPNASGRGIVVADKVIPLAKTDTVWTRLQKSIPSSAFVFSGIHTKPKPQNDPKKKAQGENTSFGFAMKICDDELIVAKAAGLFFVDKTAQKGTQYVYRIEFVIPRSDLQKGYEAVVSADEKTSVLKAVPKPAVQFRNRKMRLIFDISSTHESYSGYIIERSEDGKLFSRINNQLISFTRSQYETQKKELTFEDSLPHNGKMYWYRIKGYSYFGMEGPSSEIVNGSGREDWTCYPVADSAWSADNKTVHINWSWPYLQNTEFKNDLKSFVLLRSANVNGPYVLLITNSAASEKGNFIDTSAGFSNYYQVVAISVHNDSAATFPFMVQLQDNTPPAMPENVTGKIDTNGRVTLQWNPVTDNALKGYRVFRCNTLREEFVEITDSVITSNSFTDSVTLNTLTKDVFYAVRAVDHVWNNSDFSKPAKIARPDKIAPVKPVMRSIYHSDSTITIAWYSSTSADVEGHVLYRSCNGKQTEILRWAARDTHSVFIDTSALAGMKYTYALEVFDSAGNKSELIFPEYEFASRVRKPVANFEATADLEKKIISLRWDLPQQPADRFIIYKAKEGEELRSLKTLNGTTTSFVDVQPHPGNVYVYAIRAVMKDGGETKMISISVTY